MSEPDVHELLRDLTQPRAWPWLVSDIEVAQTHASAVFLAGEHVVKIKKPVDLGFLDFSTQERRLAACEAECRLNARLATDTYVGVVSVTRDAAGAWRIEARPPGGGDEPAVLMRRLAPEASLASRVHAGTLDRATVERVARRVAAFHDSADAGPAVRESSGWEPLAGVVTANLDQAAASAGELLAPELLLRLRAETARELRARRELIQSRAARGVGRDGHGDLRLDHVYVLDAPPPRDIVIVDCIEFRDDFRRGDPVGDVAFLVMELQFEGRADLGAAFFDAWCSARDDEEGRALLPLHLCYRHVVRGKVRAIEAHEPEIAPQARRRAAERARAHFVSGLVAIAPPLRRPTLVLACGLPGAGKSTIARGLERESGFVRVSSDETRKALAASVTAEERADLYVPEWTDRTYDACLRHARDLLRRGERVVADASFHEARRRAPFLDLARTLHVPAFVLECTTDDAEARARLTARTHDASDADAAVRAAMAASWEPPERDESPAWHALPTGPTPAHDIARAVDLLRRAGVA